VPPESLNRGTNRAFSTGLCHGPPRPLPSFARFHLWATGIFADGVSSQEIVGYQTKTTVKGFNFITPTFENTAGSEISVQDIQLDAATATSWTDEIQVLDEGGATIETYVYATAEESGLEKDGWLNGESQLAPSTLKKGQSVIVNTENPTSLTFSGVVGSSATKVQAVAGFNFVGNNSPVSIDIQSIRLDENASSWQDEIQVLDEGGATIEIYVYATAEESGLERDGWLNGESQLADRVFKPGDGFLVNIANEGTTITLPAAL